MTDLEITAKHIATLTPDDRIATALATLTVCFDTSPLNTMESLEKSIVDGTLYPNKGNGTLAKYMMATMTRVIINLEKVDTE